MLGIRLAYSFESIYLYAYARADSISNKTITLFILTNGQRKCDFIVLELCILLRRCDNVGRIFKYLKNKCHIILMNALLSMWNFCWISRNILLIPNGIYCTGVHRRWKHQNHMSPDEIFSVVSVNLSLKCLTFFTFCHLLRFCNIYRADNCFLSAHIIYLGINSNCSFESKLKYIFSHFTTIFNQMYYCLPFHET